jgi:hypothetical protein
MGITPILQMHARTNGVIVVRREVKGNPELADNTTHTGRQREQLMNLHTSTLSQGSRRSSYYLA